MGLKVEPPPFRLSEYTNEDSDGNAMLKAHAYFAQSAGFVSAYVQLNLAGDFLRGYIGLTDNPAGAGNKIQEQEMGGAVYTNSICFVVAKGEYFEITATGDEPTIWWKSYGALRKPVDHN